MIIALKIELHVCVCVCVYEGVYLILKLILSQNCNKVCGKSALIISACNADPTTLLNRRCKKRINHENGEQMKGHT